MSKKRSTPARKPRTTLPLSGTFKPHRSNLDYWSVLGLEYAGIWLVAAGSLTPPEGGIVRRALQVYVEHLADADPKAEAIAVRNVCNARDVDQDEQQKAQMRMYSDPLPLFADVVRSPKRAAELAAFNDTVEALADAAIAELRDQRSRGGKASAAKRAAAKAATLEENLPST